MTRADVEQERDAWWDEWAARKEAVDWSEMGRKCDPETIRQQYSHRGYLRHLRQMKNPAVGYAVLDTVAGLCAEVERLRALTAPPEPKRRGTKPNGDGCQSRLYWTHGVAAKCRGYLGHSGRHGNGTRSWDDDEAIENAARFGREGSK